MVCLFIPNKKQDEGSTSFLWPWIGHFKTHIKDKYIEYFLLNCCKVNATRPHWRSVNIGPGNGLVLSGKKPLLEPMLTLIYVTMHIASLGHNKLIRGQVATQLYLLINISDS